MTPGAFGIPALLVALLFAPGPQAQSDPDIEPGILLVADRRLADPNFAQTVILVARYDEEGTLGLILNRRADIPLSRAFQDWKEAAGRTDPAFLGGPVEPSATLALVRSASKPDRSLEIADGVHLSSEPSYLRKHLADRTPPGRFRVYRGYTGWGPEQLENEVDAGAWHILAANPAIVFDDDPDTLWTRLIRLTETRIAALPTIRASLR